MENYILSIEYLLMDRARRNHSMDRKTKAEYE